MDNEYLGRKSIDLSPSEGRVLYLKTIELHKQGLGKRRIGRKLNLSERLVGAWIYLGRIPYFMRANLDSSPWLSFILGCVYSDGTVYRYKTAYYVRLSSTDVEYVEEFNRALIHVVWRNYPIHSPPSQKAGMGNRTKDELVVSFSNKALWYFLSDRNLGKEHRDTIEEYPSEFVRAFFDGEGTVGTCDKWGTVSLRAYNTKREVIEYITRLLLERFGISAAFYETRSSRHNEKSIWVCRFRGLENAIKFYQKIGFTIERKQKKLEELVRNKLQNYRYIRHLEKKLNATHDEDIKRAMTELHFMKPLEGSFQR